MQVGEDGGYTNLVDENGQALETASKLRNRSAPLLLVVVVRIKGMDFPEI
jgi:hypothetical protein